MRWSWGYVYTIPDSLCADTKTISDRASVLKGIANFGAVFTTERRCATSILKVNHHVLDRSSYHSLALCELPQRKSITRSEDWIPQYLCWFLLSRTLYHEFNCFESPEKLNWMMRMPLSVEKRSGVTIYYLADEGRMRKVANAFGVGKSTVLKLVRSWLFLGCLVHSLLNIRRK